MPGLWEEKRKGHQTQNLTALCFCFGVLYRQSTAGLAATVPSTVQFDCTNNPSGSRVSPTSNANLCRHQWVFNKPGNAYICHQMLLWDCRWISCSWVFVKAHGLELFPTSFGSVATCRQLLVASIVVWWWHPGSGKAWLRSLRRSPTRSSRGRVQLAWWVGLGAPGWQRGECGGCTRVSIMAGGPWVCCACGCTDERSWHHALCREQRGHPRRAVREQPGSPRSLAQHQAGWVQAAVRSPHPARRFSPAAGDMGGTHAYLCARSCTGVGSVAAARCSALPKHRVGLAAVWQGWLSTTPAPMHQTCIPDLLHLRPGQTNPGQRARPYCSSRRSITSSGSPSPDFSVSLPYCEQLKLSFNAHSPKSTWETHHFGFKETSCCDAAETSRGLIGVSLLGRDNIIPIWQMVNWGREGVTPWLMK